MWREIKVLLIDDKESRRQEMKIILDFVGEHTIPCDSSSWQSAVDGHEGESFTCVILGDSQQGHRLAEAIVD